MKIPKSKHWRKWFLYGGLSAVLMGAGLSMVTDAAFYRHSGAETWAWVTYGTIALSVFVAGVAFFGESVLSKVRYEQEKNQKA